MPEIVPVSVTKKNKLVADVVARTSTRLRVQAMLTLQLGIQLFVYYRQFYLVFHYFTSPNTLSAKHVQANHSP